MRGRRPEEHLRIAQRIVDFLRALNRPPKKIRTDTGYTTTHELLKRRARVELGVEFPDTPGGEWVVYDDKKHAIARKCVGVCIVCGEPFLKRHAAAVSCSRACRSRKWRSKPEANYREKYNISQRKRRRMLVTIAHASRVGRSCKQCGDTLPVAKRSDTVFCSRRCSRRARDSHAAETS